MKKKTLKIPEEFPEKFAPEEKLTFSGTNPPFNCISVSSEKTLFSAWHWDYPAVMVNAGNGTAYICRKGDYPCKLDFDVLSLRLNEKGVPEVVHVYTLYHNTDKVPPFIEIQMPEEIKIKVQSYLDEGEGQSF